MYWFTVLQFEPPIGGLVVIFYIGDRGGLRRLIILYDGNAPKLLSMFSAYELKIVPEIGALSIVGLIPCLLQAAALRRVHWDNI